MAILHLPCGLSTDLMAAGRFRSAGPPGKRVVSVVRFTKLASPDANSDGLWFRTVSGAVCLFHPLGLPPAEGKKRPLPAASTHPPGSTRPGFLTTFRAASTAGSGGAQRCMSSFGDSSRTPACPGR